MEIGGINVLIELEVLSQSFLTINMFKVASQIRPAGISLLIREAIVQFLLEELINRRIGVYARSWVLTIKSRTC